MTTRAGHGPLARDCWLATVALVAWAAALLVFGALSPGFSLALQPVALLGAQGEPRALWFNLVAFVLPGLLLAWLALRLRTRAGGSAWVARVGLQLVMLSALAFAAQGLLPIDPRDLDAAASRHHALAWTLWWIAFLPGGVLAPLGWASQRAAGMALALLVPVAAMLGPELMPAPLAHRLACVAWFAWWVLASRRVRGTG